jgi:ribosomal protein S18 acetylase RimI-like enzyme
MQMRVEQAEPDDAEDILALQKLAFQVEAELYGDPGIAPLVETVEDVRAAIVRGVVLKAVTGDAIVRSVRASVADGRCHIARLAVHPANQRQGVAKRLMEAVQELVPASGYALYTGHRSEGNLRLYARLGYVEVRREVVSADLSFVHMLKVSGG